MTADRVQRIENYVKITVSALVAEDPRIAHGFGHFDWVRGWALYIAEPEIQAIATAIRLHSSVSGGGASGGIPRNADILDALSAVDMMRAFTTTYAQPEHDPRKVKGDTSGTTARECD